MELKTLLFTGVQLLLQILIINYLYHLENQGCKCAMDYKRTYILGYMVLNTIFVILGIFTNVQGCKYASNNQIGSFLMSMYAVGGILNIAFIIEYVNLLKVRKCDCSESVYRDLMYVFAIIDAIVLGMSLLLVLYVVLFLAKLNGTPVKRKRKLKR